MPAPPIAKAISTKLCVCSGFGVVVKVVARVGQRALGEVEHVPAGVQRDVFVHPAHEYRRQPATKLILCYQVLIAA